jgi:RNA polymerase sigma-70 factor (ECF subfamily)
MARDERRSHPEKSMDRTTREGAAEDHERELAHRRDRELVARVLLGDRIALDGFIERVRCAPRFLHAINERAGAPLSDAEIADLTQDVLLLIWEKLSTFEGRATLETWTWRFCWLESRNRIRRVLRNRRTSQSTSLDDVPAPEARNSIHEDALAVGLEELGPPRSEVIRLKHFEERTFVEIGEILGIPVNTAKTHYYRGLEWLRQRLRSLGEGTDR